MGKKTISGKAAIEAAAQAKEQDAMELAIQDMQELDLDLSGAELEAEKLEYTDGTPEHWIEEAVVLDYINGTTNYRVLSKRHNIGLTEIDDIIKDHLAD